MSLQRRLTLFFVLIVILPLAVAGFVVQRVVVNEISRRAVLSLAPALDATVALYEDRAEALDARVRGTLGLSSLAEALERKDPEEVSLFLRSRLVETSNLDFFLAYDRKGARLAYEMLPGDFVEGFRLPVAEEIEAAAEGVGSGFVATLPIPVRVPGEGDVGSVVGGFWVDGDLLAGSAQEGVVLSLGADSLVVASTADLDQPVPVTPEFDGSFTTDISGEAKARAAQLQGGMSIIASTPTSPIEALSRRVLASLVALLALAILGTTLLAYLLARLITQPVGELAKGAQAIAKGNYDYKIATRGKDEVGQLASAFNEMSEQLKDTIGQLSTSRDRLQRAVQRVGETLRSTHDMSQMLGSILNTAVDAVDADVGVLWRFTATRAQLYPAATSGLEEAEPGSVGVGEGIVGHVAERANNVILPSPTGDGPRAAEEEPDAPVVVGVPVYSQDRVTGVLAVYRSDTARPFTQEDLDTVVFLAEQGGVAIENVMLHEEARRLSLMDGLTGIWNRRFFQMQSRQVLATAQRFDRPFSVLMMDLDFFKRVNDTYGHPRGDSILVEFAKRVNGALREVDTFARYGGEEFIVLLPETDVDGAMITAQKICEVIRAKPFGGLDETSLDITVSIGVASHPVHGQSMKDLIDAADDALYRAKEGGRDRVVVAEEGGDSGDRSRLRLA